MSSRLMLVNLGDSVANIIDESAESYNAGNVNGDAHALGCEKGAYAAFE